MPCLKTAPCYLCSIASSCWKTNEEWSTILSWFFYSVRIMQMTETGLMDYWKKKLWPSSSNNRRCNTAGPRREGPRSLSLDDMQSPFVIWGIGSGLALIVFILEKMIHWIYGHRIWCEFQFEINLMVALGQQNFLSLLPSLDPFKSWPTSTKGAIWPDLSSTSRLPVLPVYFPQFANFPLYLHKLAQFFSAFLKARFKCVDIFIRWHLRESERRWPDISPRTFPCCS